MDDKKFLKWLHARLEHIHKESPDADYMRRLLDMADALPDGKVFPKVKRGGKAHRFLGE